jgi:hypothetical protein
VFVSGLDQTVVVAVLPRVITDLNGAHPIRVSEFDCMGNRDEDPNHRREL